jgi:hypothetical protein
MSMDKDGADSRFRELSPEILGAISADEIGAAVVQHVHHRVSSGLDEKRVMDELPRGTWAIYATWLVDAEVLNGGFNQFFFNRSVAAAGEALLGYELLGAEDHAAVMRAAIATFESERDRLLPFHEKGTLEAFSKSHEHTELSAVDQRYYALGDRIYEIWATSVHDRPELFRAAERS